MNQVELSTNYLLDDQQLQAVSGGSAYEDGKMFGGALGDMYWGARNYLSGSVYPYWFG
jgi:hypothetical protein